MTAFTWTCDKCGKPIADGSGYICVDDSAAYRILRHRAELSSGARRQVTLIRASDIEIPGVARWHVWHRACDPHADGDGYWFGVERCRTLEHLLDWNAHLAEKNWIRHTDWGRFIQRRLAANAIMRSSSEA